MNFQILKRAELSTHLSKCASSCECEPNSPINLQVQALLVLVAPVSPLTPLAPAFPSPNGEDRSHSAWLCGFVGRGMGFGVMQTGVETHFTY